MEVNNSFNQPISMSILEYHIKMLNVNAKMVINLENAHIKPMCTVEYIYDKLCIR